MILDSGLDAICTTTPNGSYDAYPDFGFWIRYAAIGTGSLAPEASQNALENEVARTTDRGGFSNLTASARDTSNEVIYFEAEMRRVFDINSAIIVAEWGLAQGNVSNLSVRDLFREDPTDPNSTPVAIDLQAGDQLQLIIKYRVEALWIFEEDAELVIEGTPGNDGNGTHAAKYCIINETDSRIKTLLSSLWPGTPSAMGYHTTTFDGSYGRTDNWPTPASLDTMPHRSYEPGTFFRESVRTFSTNQALGDITALVVSNATITSIAERAGVWLYFTNPTSFTKTDKDELSVVFRKSVARA